MKSILAFRRLYLKVTFYLTISSGAAMKSRVSISKNLYSRFSMKSSRACPSLYMKKTEKKLEMDKCGKITDWVPCGKS